MAWLMLKQTLTNNMGMAHKSYPKKRTLQESLAYYWFMEKLFWDLQQFINCAS